MRPFRSSSMVARAAKSQLLFQSNETEAFAASGAGVLTTAGGLVFTGDGGGNFVAFDAADGDLLWNTRIGNISNAPQTYLIDGRQHVLVAAGQQLFAFLIY